MIDDADVEKIASRLAVVLRKDRRAEVALLTIPEVAAKYREDRETVRRAAKEGRVKSRPARVRNGKESFLIDAKDAERVFGAH